MTVDEFKKEIDNIISEHWDKGYYKGQYQVIMYLNCKFRDSEKQNWSKKELDELLSPWLQDLWDNKLKSERLIK